MAARKPRKKTRATSNTGELSVDPMLFERLLRLEAETRASAYKSRVADLEWQQQVLKRTSDARALSVELEKAKQAYASTLKEIEKKYGISMKEYGYDIETGRLSKLP